MTNPLNPGDAPTWEYLIVKDQHRGPNRHEEELAQLNGYGYDGWELVSTHREEKQIETGGQPDPVTVVTYYLKRRR